VSPSEQGKQLIELANEEAQRAESIRRQIHALRQPAP